MSENYFWLSKRITQLLGQHQNEAAERERRIAWLQTQVKFNLQRRLKGY